MQHAKIKWFMKSDVKSHKIIDQYIKAVILRHIRICVVIRAIWTLPIRLIIIWMRRFYSNVTLQCHLCIVSAVDTCISNLSIISQTLSSTAYICSVCNTRYWAVRGIRLAIIRACEMIPPSLQTYSPYPYILQNISWCLLINSCISPALFSNQV